MIRTQWHLLVCIILDNLRFKFQCSTYHTLMHHNNITHCIRVTYAETLPFIKTTCIGQTRSSLAALSGLQGDEAAPRPAVEQGTKQEQPSTSGMLAHHVNFEYEHLYACMHVCAAGHPSTCATSALSDEVEGGRELVLAATHVMHVF